MPSRLLHFNIDDHINPYLPHVPISRLPRPVSRFLGYRETPDAEVPSLLIWCWAFMGAFIGLITVQSLNLYAPGLQKWNPPVIVASLGASAILDYHAIHTPLAQPRNALVGQTLCAFIGVCITKLFLLSSNFDQISWVAGALACATASFAMGATNTVHPPGGATAVLAATNAEVMAMGWMFIPFVMLGSSVMLAIALLVNNIQRQYPNYWWTSEQLPRRHVADLEKISSTESDQTLRHDADPGYAAAYQDCIVISGDRLLVPSEIELDEQEMEMMEHLQKRFSQGITRRVTSVPP